MSNNLVQFLNQYVHEHRIKSTGEVINIKPITTGQMKSILVYEDTDDSNKIEEILDDILLGCVDGKFNVDGLTLQDRFDLLIDIRKVTKGNIYNFSTKCPVCGTEIINNIDLNNLTYVEYKPSESSKISLTDDMSVYLTPVTRGMQKEAIKLTDKIKGLNDRQRSAEIATYIYALAMSKFDTPAGEIDNASVEDKKELLDNLDRTAYKAINNWFEVNDYGIKFTYSSKCVNGDWENEDIGIPVSGFFF